MCYLDIYLVVSFLYLGPVVSGRVFSYVKCYLRWLLQHDLVSYLSMGYLGIVLCYHFGHFFLRSFARRICCSPFFSAPVMATSPLVFRSFAWPSNYTFAASSTDASPTVDILFFSGATSTFSLPSCMALVLSVASGSTSFLVI